MRRFEFDAREIENYLRASKLSPAKEFAYRLALAPFSPRLRGMPRTHELMAHTTTDELAQIMREASDNTRELGEFDAALDPFAVS